MVPEETSKLEVGCRIELAGHKGTVKYIGEVANTQNQWLGVDWDDPKRGKHDGTYEGVRYFKTWHPNSGSFVRPAKVNVGTSIVEAIKKRYGLINDANVGVDVQSVAEIQKEIKAKFFEVVGVEKLNKRQSEFQNLEVVLLRDEPVCIAGPPQELLTLCPNIKELDLSGTLINCWTVVAEIVGKLKRLKILNLSDNRLQIPDNLNMAYFETVEHLVLGRMNYSWRDVLRCVEAFPNMAMLQVPFNTIECLSTPPTTVLQKLVCLDLEGSPLQRWTEVNKLGGITTLELLNLTDCQLEEVQFPDSDGFVTDLFPRLTQLVLSDNRIADWRHVSQLDRLAALQDLKFRSNPVLARENLETNRQLVIVRIKQLQVFNGIRILPEERRGAEFDFLKRHGVEWLSISTEEQRRDFDSKYPNYRRLVEKWGAPEESELKKMPTSLKSQLIQVEIFSPDHEVRSVSKKIPFNMSVQKLTGLAQRVFNTGCEIPRLACVHSKRQDVEVPLDNEMKDLNFYSIENGDKISVRW